MDGAAELRDMNEVPPLGVVCEALDEVEGRESRAANNGTAWTRSCATRARRPAKPPEDLHGQCPVEAAVSKAANVRRARVVGEPPLLHLLREEGRERSTPSPVDHRVTFTLVILVGLGCLAY